MAYVSCIIYDLDGTLADTAPDITAAVNRLRRNYGLSELEEGHVRNFIGHGAEELLLSAIHGKVSDPIWRPSDILPKSAVEMSELLAQFRDIYSEAPVVGSKLKKGVALMLKHWQAEGTAQVVLTNKPDGVTQQVLHGLYLDKVFDLVVGAGALDDDGKVLPGKPDPAIIDWILEQTGAEKDETFLVGDGVPDVEVAKAAGISCIGILDGYTEPDTLLEILPDLELAAVTIERAHELLLERHDG